MGYTVQWPRAGLRGRAWGSNPALPLPGCVTQGQSLHLSVPWFSHLQEGTMMTFHSLVLRMKCVNECKSHKPGPSTGPTDRWCRPLSLLSPCKQFQVMGMGVRERLGADSCLFRGCFASCLTLLPC